MLGDLTIKIHNSKSMIILDKYSINKVKSNNPNITMKNLLEISYNQNHLSKEKLQLICSLIMINIFNLQNSQIQIHSSYNIFIYPSIKPMKSKIKSAQKKLSEIMMNKEIHQDLKNKPIISQHIISLIFNHKSIIYSQKIINLNLKSLILINLTVENQIECSSKITEKHKILY